MNKQVCLKKASTNWDTDRKRCRPPAWDPPKLLLVIDGLHVVVSTLVVVVVVVDGGIWFLGSTICLRHPERKEKGKRGSKATVSTHPKYSQARIYTTYALVSMKWVVSMDRTIECQNRRGIASPIEDYASGSLRLAACRRE